MSETQKQNKQNLSDEEMVSLINNGDFVYFSTLIAGIMPHIVATASKWQNLIPDTEDLIEEGVLAVFTAVKSYDFKSASFKTFAKLCVDRAIGAKVKAASAEKRIPNTLVTSIDGMEIPHDITPEDIFINREESSDFTASLKDNLSQLELNVLYLFLQGLGYSQIAEKLGVTVKSVDSALQRIRNKLKK